MYSSPSLLDAFTPPVPPIPAEHRTPVHQSSTDSQTSPRLDVTKPLPPILPSPVRESSDIDTSMVFIEKSSLAQEPIPISRTTTTANGTVTPKRRSMSVGDADLKKAVIASSANSPLPPTPNLRDRLKQSTEEQWEDSSIHNIIDQFKGELSQLESSSGATLDLQDPSTPARQSAYRRQLEATITPNRMSQYEFGRSGTKRVEDVDATVVPPRSSSLQLPIHSSSGSTSASTSPRPIHTMPSAGLLKPRVGLNGNGFASPRDANRLRVLHRSTASSSEPSLLPIIDDARMCEYNLSAIRHL